MSEDNPKRRRNLRPDWLEEFEKLANDQLEEGTACRQVHPIIESWYRRLIEESEPPESRDAVLQAIACLSTELVNDMPDSLYDLIGADNEEEQDELAFWIQEILMIGRAFQLALDNGELDDL